MFCPERYICAEVDNKQNSTITKPCPKRAKSLCIYQIEYDGTQLAALTTTTAGVQYFRTVLEAEPTPVVQRTHKFNNTSLDAERFEQAAGAIDFIRRCACVFP